VITSRTAATVGAWVWGRPPRSGTRGHNRRSKRWTRYSRSILRRLKLTKVPADKTAASADSPLPAPWVQRLGVDGARDRHNFRRADLCTALVLGVGIVACVLGPKSGTVDQRSVEWAVILIPIVVVLVFFILLSGHFQKKAVRSTLEHHGLRPGVWLPIRSLRSLQAFDAWLKGCRPK
jgi:hypothetical protein